ncbi:MAG: DUF169 domain-containing protein [Candidatus Helarchaeota archaeon]|nr:DUF169 domain-containing protein [Candidatus Helarchaeota archaeon]
MVETIRLPNREIAKRFEKYVKLLYMPLGMYFSETKPPGKVRRQRMIINRCIVGHVFKAAKWGGSSIIMKGAGCPGGQFWAGFRKKIIRGWASFLTKGRPDVLGGRAERMKKDVNVATRIIKEPGPIALPEGTNFIVYRPLREIPDDQPLEFILFFVDPERMAKLITLCNYARHAPYMVRAPAGAGCMSILNFPLLMKKAPEPDAVMGVWDLYSRMSIPHHILTLTIRRWLVEDMALDIPESFLAHTPPFTVWGEIKHFFKKLKRNKNKC